MIKQENKYTNISGTFPDALIIDASGAGLTDGSEYAALQLNDNWDPFQQSIMDYANGGTNQPTGTLGTPNGVADAKGINQIIQAIQGAHGIGPGMYVQRAIYDAPGTWGDRVLELSGQGILHAVYPDLLAAVYVGDANNATVAAAGGKFYKSTDAAGATPSTAGTYLQLPENPTPSFLKQYVAGNTYNSVALTVSGTNWTTIRGVFTPYQTIDGAWRLIFNISGTVAPNASTNTLSISNVVFKAVANVFQPVAVFGTSGGTSCFGYVTQNTGNIVLTIGGASGNHCVSGDVELDSKPTWVEDFEIQWGITY